MEVLTMFKIIILKEITTLVSGRNSLTQHKFLSNVKFNGTLCLITNRRFYIDSLD